MRPSVNIAMLALNVAVWFASLGTCAYAVFWLHHSGWWFVLALIVASAGQHSPTKKEAEDGDTSQ